MQPFTKLGLRLEKLFTSKLDILKMCQFTLDYSHRCVYNYIRRVKNERIKRSINRTRN